MGGLLGRAGEERSPTAGAIRRVDKSDLLTAGRTKGGWWERRQVDSARIAMRGIKERDNTFYK